MQVLVGKIIAVGGLTAAILGAVLSGPGPALTAQAAPARPAAPAVPAAPAAYAAPAARAAPDVPAAPAAGGGCYPVDFTWICVDSGGSGGSPGTGGGSSKISCTYTKASPAELQRTGTGPPNPGFQWDIMTCPGSAGGALGGQLVQVSTTTGAPAISPVDLLKIAIGELHVPTLAVQTAPPRGKDGLVGLPEWFWIPASQWKKTSVTVSAGPVFADATAAPTSITFAPGGGQSDTTCAGPGTAFNPRQAASGQRTSCSYTYSQPSAGQPGNAYQAALMVTWTISWVGSGGAGGTITTGYTTGTAFAVRVAQAEALVRTP
ncbi:MAG TPA: hypothetical protein VFI65_12750 [Streptosporangiaceae bacterium]|nr:hypothetical protein [Streptosporangiaceae bacterium]